MRTDLIRRYKTLHTWTGIIAGFALFIAFYGGALSMFKEPIADWASSTRAAAHDGARERDPAALDALFGQVLLARPDARQVVVHLDGSPRLPGGVVIPGREDTDPVLVAHATASGPPRFETATPTPLAEWIDMVHRTAGIPGDPEIGIHAMGVVSALYALALISGVIVLLPTLLQDLLALRIGKNRKRMWLDAHNLLGVASLPFHVVMAVSAVVFAFHHEIYAVQDASVFRGSQVADAAFAAQRPREAPLDSLLAPSAAKARIAGLSPEFRIVSMQYRLAPGDSPRTRRATLFVSGHAPDRFLRGGNFGVVTLDAGDGRVLGDSFLPGRQRGWGHAVAGFFALHFGNFGGPAVRWAYFLLGIAGALVFYTGNLLWVESRRKAARNGAPPVLQTRSARHLAAATVGVCLGCVAGLSASVAATHWAAGSPAAGAWHEGAYYACFLAAFAWAMWRGAARAAAELLGAAALVTALVPAVSLLALAWPGASALATEGRPWAVELVAAASASLLAWSARLSWRRARRAGQADSVWAAPAPSSPATEATT